MTELAGTCKGAFLHRVLHTSAALDYDEAVGLLDHHADQPDGRLKVVAVKVGEDLVLRLHDGDRSHRLVAVLEPLRAFRPLRARRTLDCASALSLFVPGDSLRRGARSRKHRGAAE